MRRAAMLLLVALLVGALPAAAVPISMFPEPFVKAGTIYTSDGKATMAIIIGDKAATFDMIGAAMLAMKIGSHLYYTNAPYVNVDDAAKHGITLYYGGFSANVYNISTVNFTVVDSPINLTGIGNKSLTGKGYMSSKYELYYCYSDSTLKHNITGYIYYMGPGIIKTTATGKKVITYCNPEGYDFWLMPLDQSITPAKFHYILGEHVDDINSKNYPYIVNSSDGTGFYLQTGLKEFSNATGDVNIPWLGFKLHVDNVNVTKGGWIRMRMIAPDTGTTVAFLNVTNGAVFDGSDHTDPTGTIKIIGDVNIRTKVVVTNPKTGDEVTIKHAGVPYFKISNWIVLPQFGVILANLTSQKFTASAVTDEIAYYYGNFGAKARFSTVTYPVKGAWAVWNVTGESKKNWTYIWSKDVFPWFDGAVNAYFVNETAITNKKYIGDLYVFNKTYGIGTWNFNETKKIGCYEYLFSSIGNLSVPGAVTCPLTETVVSKEKICTFICGGCTGGLTGDKCGCAGVYKIESKEMELKPVTCPEPMTFDTTTSLTAKVINKATVYPRGATGVFAGIFDRFENVTGFKGTTQLKIETSGNITYARDVTQPADVDQIFEGEAVFSFVKMPIIYLDSWVFVNNTLSDAVKDKDLILIGGPAVNTIVKYLNDAKLLDVTFTQVNGVWALSYKGKTYDLDTVLKILVDQGYLPVPISKEYVYRVEGGNGLGVVEYATKNPFGSGNILVVAGTDRYGTLAASVALADPTKLASSTAPVFYAAGRTAPNAVILLGIKPTAVPPPAVPAALTPVIVAIPAGAAG